MIIRKAFKFKLKPNQKLIGKFFQFAGCNRFVFNKTLALQKEKLETEKKVFSYNQVAAFLTGWKKEEDTFFLKEVHSQPLQQTLKDLDRALKDAFKKKKGFPKFKKRGLHDSFRYPQGVKVEGSNVFLPKIGKIRFVKSREIEGEIKNTTVSFKSGHWYVSFQTEFERIEPVHPSNSRVGIDLGIKRFATLSNGDFFNPLSSFRTLEKKLAKEQRKLARKTKFSNNWKKQKSKITSLHSKIANSRKDYLHKISTLISKNHAMVVLEDLKVSNMSKSAKGTKETPGKNVKAKSGLNKSILDQGWYEFKRQLEYKLEWLGGKLVLINPKNTSRKCFNCSHTEKENRKTQSEFKCVKCGYTANADLNASLNILAAGLTAIACGDTKQVA